MILFLTDSIILTGKKKDRKKTDGPKKKKTRTTFTAYQVIWKLVFIRICPLIQDTPSSKGNYFFCHVCNICNAQFSVQLEELERAFERAPYPDVFASEVSSLLLCIENIEILENIKIFELKNSAPYPDVFASEVSSVLLCIENIKMLKILRYLNQRIVLHIQMSLQVRFSQIASFFCIFTCVHVFLLVELLALFWKGQKLSCPPPPGAHSKTIGGKSQILKQYVGTFWKSRLYSNTFL